MTRNCFISVHKIISLFLDVNYELTTDTTTASPLPVIDKSRFYNQIDVARSNDRVSKIISHRGFCDDEYNRQHVLMQARRRCHWR